MDKRKRKQRVINHIRNVNLEIDYDKLAKAFAKVTNEEAQANQTQFDKMKQKVSLKTFVKNVIDIVFNRKQQNSDTTASLFAKSISIIFNFCAISGLVFFVYDMITMYNIIKTSENIKQIIICVFIAVLFGVICLTMSLIFRGIANEIKLERDRNYIVSVFSGIVSFAALIVALVALFKGVG